MTPRATALALLLPMALATPSGAASRPALPELPLGTGSEAFLGGGAGHAGGLDALFSNPGALSLPAGREVELGAMALSGELSPYSLFGGRSGAWTYAAGTFYDRRAGAARGGLVAGGAREFVPGASAGAAVRSQGGPDGSGVDADVGLLLRPPGRGPLGGWPVLALAVRNLAESGMGQEPEGYRTHRSYAVAAGARGGPARLLRLPIREPDVVYAFRAEGAGAAGSSHVLSAGVGLAFPWALHLRAALRLADGGAARVALAGSLRLPFRSGSLGCGYAFSADGAGTPGAGQAHSVALRLALGTRADRLPPWVAVRADRVYLGAETPGQDRVHFRLRAADRTPERPWAGGGGSLGAGLERDAAGATGETESAVRGELDEWTLVLFAADAQGRKGAPARTFRGRDLPPRLIRWDGRGDDGAALAPGYYAFRFAATDKAGNRGETAWQLLELGSGSPVPEPGAAGASGGAASGSAPAGAEGGSGSAGEPGPAAGPRPEEGIRPEPPIVEGEDG